MLIEKELINSITLLDEYKVCKETIQFLSQKHTQLLKMCMDAMSKDNVDFLRSIHSTVQIDDKPRQVVRVKRG